MSAHKVRTLPILRGAHKLFLELVLKGFPEEVFRCVRCVREDGSYITMTFDGLYIGIREKHRPDVDRLRAALSSLKGAMTWIGLVKDSVMVSLLARDLRPQSADGSSTDSIEPIKTLQAMKATVLSISTLNPEALLVAPDSEAAGGDADSIGATVTRSGPQTGTQWKPAL